MEIDKETYMNMVAVMCSGALSNPAASYMLTSSYDRQMLVQNILQDVGQGLANAGIVITDNKANEL